MIGIDVYARWDGQTAAEKAEQTKAVWKIDGARVGYLHEDLLGEPFAMKYLVPEAFDHPEGVAIPAATLRERLPKTLGIAGYRERMVYGKPNEEIEPTLKSYREFVKFCQRMEKKTGKPVRIFATF